MIMTTMDGEKLSLETVRKGVNFVIGQTRFLTHILPVLDDGIAVAKTPSTMGTMLSTMMTGKNGSLMKMVFNGLTKKQLTMKMTMDVKRTLQPMRMQRPSTMRRWQTIWKPNRNRPSFVSHVATFQLWL